MVDLNSKLSPRLRVQPLRPGEVAVFQLVNAYKKESGREEPSCPELWQTSAREEIFDPGLGRKILLEAIDYYETREREDGSTYQKPVYKKLWFLKGELTVTAEEQDVYVRLMRSKGFEGNPFRPKGAKTIFRLKNSKKEITDKLALQDLTFLAEKLVRESDWTERRAMVANMNKFTDSRLHIKSSVNDLQGTMFELIMKAKSFPKLVINSSGNINAKIRVQLEDGCLYNILLFTPETSEWSLSMSEGKTMESLCTVSPEEDRFDALLKHFTTEQGRNQYAKFASELRKILKATA